MRHSVTPDCFVVVSSRRDVGWEVVSGFQPAAAVRQGSKRGLDVAWNSALLAEEVNAMGYIRYFPLLPARTDAYFRW